MARTPLLRALRRLAREHEAASHQGITPAELRRRPTPELSRRDFLKGAAALGALTPALRFVPALAAAAVLGVQAGSWAGLRLGGRASTKSLKLLMAAVMIVVAAEKHVLLFKFSISTFYLGHNIGRRIHEGFRFDIGLNY